MNEILVTKLVVSSVCIPFGGWLAYAIIKMVLKDLRAIRRGQQPDSVATNPVPAGKCPYGSEQDKDFFSYTGENELQRSQKLYWFTIGLAVGLSIVFAVLRFI